MNYITKTYKILPDNFKKRIPFLLFLLLVGLLFETIGLGILIPYFSVLLENDIINEYPQLAVVIELIGNPNQNQLILYGIIFILIFYLIKSLFYLYSRWMLINFVNNLTASIMDKLFTVYLNRDYNFHTQKGKNYLV